MLYKVSHGRNIIKFGVNENDNFLFVVVLLRVGGVGFVVAFVFNTIQWCILLQALHLTVSLVKYMDSSPTNVTFNFFFCVWILLCIFCNNSFYFK